MKKISILLVLCVMVLLFGACRQDRATDVTNSTTQSDTILNNQITSSGIELEEDVFEENDNQSDYSNPKPSQNTTSNTSSTTSSGEISSDETPDREENTNSEELTADKNEGIKLPIDKFN